MPPKVASLLGTPQVTTLPCPSSLGLTLSNSGGWGRYHLSSKPGVQSPIPPAGQPQGALHHASQIQPFSKSYSLVRIFIIYLAHKTGISLVSHTPSAYGSRACLASGPGPTSHPPHLQLSPAQKASVPPGLVSSFNLSHPKPRTVTGSSLASYSPHLQCSLPLRLYPWLLPCETLPLAATVPVTTVISCPSFYTPDATFSNVSILKPSLDMHVQLATRALHLRESQEHRRLLSTAKN